MSGQNMAALKLFHEASIANFVDRNNPQGSLPGATGDGFIVAPVLRQHFQLRQQSKPVGRPQCSTIRPPSNRSRSNTQISNDLPFGGPINPPRFVPRALASTQTLSPSATIDSITRCKSGRPAAKLDIALQSLNRWMQSKLMFHECGRKQSYKTL